ncbi:MAG: hypothetical protein ACR2PS_11085 [Pseudomonadales bacterium]
MDRRSQAIQNALPILARAVGRKLDVEVDIGGNDACTDGMRIQLPTLPFSDPEVETLAFGYLEHEAAHVRYTEDVVSTSKLHETLTNAFEDIRIEAKLGREYPGFAVTLKKLVTLLVKDGEFTPPGKDDPIEEKLGKYILFRLRSEALGQTAISDYAQIAEKLFREAVPAGAATRVGSVLGRARDMKSTQDASDLALEVIQMLEEAKDQLPKPKPDSQREGQPNLQGPTGTPKDQCSGSEPNPTDAAMRQELEKLLASDGAPGVSDLGQQTGTKLKDAATSATSGTGDLSAGIGNASAPLVGAGDADKIMQSVHGATSALRTRLRGFVEATKRNRRVYTRRGTRFDGRRAVQGMLGDPRLYQRKIMGVAIDTATQILMDRSSSMDSRMQVARQSALSCAAALEEISGVRVGAAAFPGYQAVVDPLTYFGEKVVQTAPRYAGVKASGGTPLLPALMWAVDQLLQQPEKRKLLLVVTDGEPAQMEACVEVIRRCWFGDIEAMGIGILVPSITRLFPVSTCINDVSELASAMFAMLQAGITQRKVV